MDSETVFGPQLQAAGFEPVDTTIELFEQEGGGKWWRENGSAREGYFYLERESQSILALEDYLTEIRINLDE